MGDRNEEDDGGSTDGSDGVSPAERAVTVASVLLTLGVFLAVGWQAVAGGGAAPPAVDVTVTDDVTETDGETYEVLLRNPGDRGFASVTVVVNCGDPPRRFTFEHVPASGTAEGTVVCPPDAETPPAEVVQWVRP